MKSKAHFKSHPLHPMLIAFPVAFDVGTLVFDVLGYFLENSSFWQTGQYLCLAAVISALIAALPGAVDYFSVVPPNSSAKKRATKHALINISVVALFFVSYIIRDEDPALLVIGIELVGVGLVSIAGWLGATLVYRNQIGVDIRYAQAGKWKEETLSANSGKVKVNDTAELKLNQMMLLHAGDKRIVLGRTESGIVAFDDHCTHRGGSLAGGSMICGTVQCPWHGSQFSVETGEVKAGPAKEKIKTYKVSEVNGEVFLEL